MTTDNSEGAIELSGRQQAVLRAVVAGYVGEAVPVGSKTVSYLLPVPLSSASVRTTMAELTRMGLLDKPHASAGRVPSEAGLRLFLDRILDLSDVGSYARRSLDHSYDALESEAAVRRTSHLLTEHTGQLGFVLAPRLESVTLKRVSLIRVSSERLLVVLISGGGQVYQRVIEDAGVDDGVELEQLSALLNEIVDGCSLSEAKHAIERQMRALRSEADRLRRRALLLALRALDESSDDPSDLLMASTVVLLDHPEFHDPERAREIFQALETHGRLIEVIDEILSDQVSVALGADLGAAGLRDCAMIAAPYGPEDHPVGALGVIGPSRMDYGRIIPLVGYTSRLISQKLNT